jgi:prophage antirepressor-like protein
MITIPYDEYHHLTGFQFLFDDGIKPAFLLTSLSAFMDQEMSARTLQRCHLRYGHHYVKVNASELIHDLPNWQVMRGTRIVLSLSGVLRVVLANPDGSDFSDRLADWITEEVLPAIMHDGYYLSSDVDEMVTELRQRFSQAMEITQQEISELREQNAHLRRLVGGYGDTTLSDMIGKDL